MAIENTVSSDFDPLSSIVKSVFDCRLSGVVILLNAQTEKRMLKVSDRIVSF